METDQGREPGEGSAHSPSDSAPTWAFVAEGVAAAARQAWLPVWPTWKQFCGHEAREFTESADTSVATSLALRDALATAVPQVVWRVAGGRAANRREPAGYYDGRGWQPHFWVVGRADRIELIVDITSDQFAGGVPVHASESGNDHYIANLSNETLNSFEYHGQESTAYFLEVFAASLARDQAWDQD
jgi:hypothetical protein